jgi:hypothetical protein
VEGSPYSHQSKFIGSVSVDPTSGTFAMSATSVVWYIAPEVMYQSEF